MFFTECLLQALNGINANLTGIRNLLRHQLEQQSKETPKEAAMSEHKETGLPVTTGEAKQALRLFSEKTDNDYEKLIMTWAADRLEKEAAPAPKAITWQEAAKTLRDLCEAQRYCADCPAQAWCDSAVPINTKVITPREWEVPANE